MTLPWTACVRLNRLRTFLSCMYKWGMASSTAHQFIYHNIRAALWTNYRWNVRMFENTARLRTSIPDTSIHPFGMTLLGRAWVRLNRLRIVIGHFCSCSYKWGMASFATCECGAEEQTVDHAVLQCPIHRPHHELHGLTVLYDETNEWLLNTCTEI